MRSHTWRAGISNGLTLPRCRWVRVFQIKKDKGSNSSFNSSKWETSKLCSKDSNKSLINSSKLTTEEIKRMEEAFYNKTSWRRVMKALRPAVWTVWMISASAWTRPSQTSPTKSLEMTSRWFQTWTNRHLPNPNSQRVCHLWASRMRLSQSLLRREWQLAFQTVRLQRHQEERGLELRNREFLMHLLINLELKLPLLLAKNKFQP